MIAHQEGSKRSARDYLPEKRTLPVLRGAAAVCQGCELFQGATQTVFGVGTSKASLMLVGEQPGDQEDLQGKPFVGPAGQVLDEALKEAGIDRSEVYVTNAVKHFYHEDRGKRRLHKKPSSRHISACRPWLEAEIETVAPEGIVCLGATAAQSLIGPAFRLTKQRGEFLESDRAGWILATYHPSAVLRAIDSESRAELKNFLIADLKKAAQRVGTSGKHRT
jgi:DNA polymerase